MPSYEQPYLREGALQEPAAAVDSRAVFGQVMGLVAVTVGFFALGAYIGRDLSNTTGFILFIGAFPFLFRLYPAVKRAGGPAQAPLFAVGVRVGAAAGR